eukprot:COSAG02_NODE_1709_length_11226_cov_5.225937_11_plen_39_part_00
MAGRMEARLPRDPLPRTWESGELQPRVCRGQKGIDRKR